MSSVDDESIPDIVKEIDSVQETTQHSVVLEHRWSIWDICDLINQKSPGEKIESDQFSFKPTEGSHNDDFDLKHKEINKVNSPNPVKTHNTEIVCERLINNSQWRIELRHSINDAESLSICTLFHLNLAEFTFLGQHNFSLIFKLNFYLLNSEANLLFKRQVIEETLDLSEVIAKNLRNKSKFVKEFQVGKFCKTTELIEWLTRNKSNDICIILDIKIYRQIINISYESGFDTKSRIKSKVSRSKNAASFFSQSLSNFSSASSASWFQADAGLEPKKEKISQLSKSFKTAWNIKNWRNFIVLSSTPHTFVSEADLPKLMEHGEGLKFTKLKTKLFHLYTKPSDNDGIPMSKFRVEKLLEEIKWKLQLYPNGYNKELEKNISLFVNFCSLNGELKELSSKLNGTKYLDTLYDSDTSSGLILLVDSPNHLSSQGDLLKKKRNNSNELFVKASFHISIIDSTGRKVDKCQSDKQLFELFGSWGYKEYMSVKELLGSRNTYLTDNSTKLTLHCKIVLYYTLTKKCKLDCVLEKKEKLHNLIKPGVLSDAKKINKAPLEESNSLLFDMQRLLKHSTLYDLIVQASFNINDPRPESFKQFKAHKLILSMRSQVFEKMFRENNYESSSSSSLSLKQDQKNNLFMLTITDFEAFIVEIFLNYLYTDKLDLDLSGKGKRFFSEESESSEEDSNRDEDQETWLKTSLRNDLCMHVLIELFKIADKYCVHRLKRICEQELEAQINVDTAVELLIVAYLYNSNRLKNLCFEVLTDNLSTIISQPNWTHLEKSYPSLLAEAFKVIYVKKYNG